MKTLVARFVKDQSGATAIEYGLIAAGISVAIIAVVQGLGTKLKRRSSRSPTTSSKRQVDRNYGRLRLQAGAFLHLR